MSEYTATLIAFWAAGALALVFAWIVIAIGTPSRHEELEAADLWRGSRDLDQPNNHTREVI
jgi:hypothetical protein